MDCNEIAEQELKRLRDIQRLLQFLAKKIGGLIWLHLLGHRNDRISKYIIRG